MSNYILADIKRIFHKKSFIQTLEIYVGLFLLMIFILFNPTFTKEDFISKTNMFLGFFPLVVGLAIFLSIYYDDFKSKSMQVAIGYGISRYQIVLCKLIESLVLSFACIMIMGVVVLVIPFLLGFSLSGFDITYLMLCLFIEGLRSIGYIAIAAIPAFYTQNAVNGTIFYVLLSSRTVLLLLNMVLSQEFIIHLFGNIGNYLYTTQLYIIKNTFLKLGSVGISLLLMIVIYVVIPFVISIVCFHQQELEF